MSWWKKKTPVKTLTLPHGPFQIKPAEDFLQKSGVPDDTWWQELKCEVLVDDSYFVNGKTWFISCWNSSLIGMHHTGRVFITPSHTSRDLLWEIRDVNIEFDMSYALFKISINIDWLFPNYVKLPFSEVLPRSNIVHQNSAEHLLCTTLQMKLLKLWLNNIKNEWYSCKQLSKETEDKIENWKTLIAHARLMRIFFMYSHAPDRSTFFEIIQENEEDLLYPDATDDEFPRMTKEEFQLRMLMSLEKLMPSKKTQKETTKKKKDNPPPGPAAAAAATRLHQSLLV